MYLTELTAELNETTASNAIAVPTDITDRTQVTEGFDRVHSEFGPVDLLVNNAYPTGDITRTLAFWLAARSLRVLATVLSEAQLAVRLA